jgi:hypothetical protein
MICGSAVFGRQSSVVIAVEDGLPYQTLISRVLHRYISGRLV